MDFNQFGSSRWPFFSKEEEKRGIPVGNGNKMKRSEREWGEIANSTDGRVWREKGGETDGRTATTEPKKERKKRENGGFGRCVWYGAEWLNVLLQPPAQPGI